MNDTPDPVLLERRALVPTFPVLETARLHLVEVPADPAWYLAHFSRPEIVRGTGYPAPDGLDGARQELDHYIVGLFERREGIRWGLEPKASPGELIGTAGFHRWRDEPEPIAEVGYDLALEWWGKGLMTEALAAIIDLAFTRLHLACLEAMVLVGNDRSSRTLERSRFMDAGVLPLHGEDEHGTPHDMRRFIRRRP